MPKPHLKFVNGQPVVSERGRESPVESARRRFGKPFAHERGSPWEPKAVPVLTAWLQTRGKS